VSHRVILSITTIIALIFYSWGIDSWQFVSVGDDLPFFTFAKSIVAAHFILNPFSFHGIYNQNSILSSMYQAVFLYLFGPTNFAWRFSNIILIVPISICFYLWLRKLFDAQVALFSTIILQSSFYLANFFKIGKNMPQALALFVACLWAASRCADHPSKKNFLILGVLLGISFYIYIGPIFPLIVWPCLLPLLKKYKTNKLLLPTFLLIGSYLLLLLPAFLQMASLTGPAGKTFLYREYHGLVPIFFNILRNIFLFYHNYDYIYNHFVAGPYLDIASRMLAFIGSMIAIYYITRRNYLILVATYLMTCIVIGITSPYLYTPTTRGLFFLPFGAALAGIALAQLNKKILLPLTITILCFIFLGNIYLSQIGVFTQTGHSSTTLITKTLQESQKMKRTDLHVLVLSDKSRYNPQLVKIARSIYHLEKIPFIVVKASKLQCTQLVHTQVILLASDIDALSSVYQQDCPGFHPSNVQILTPSKGLQDL